MKRKKLSAPILLFVAMLLLGVLNFAHIAHSVDMHHMAMETVSDPSLIEFNNVRFDKDIKFETAISILDLCAFLLILFVRQKEKTTLENEREVEKLARLEAQMREEAKEQVIKAKESFLIMFTHELKTPLNAIINFSKYICKKAVVMSDGDKILSLSNGILKNGQSMLDTVNNLLEINRIRSGKTEFEYENILLSDLIADVILKYKALADESKSVASFEIQDNIVVRSSRFYLEHIISNLYTNAIKYGKGKVFLGVEYKNATDWKISIEDNGDGILDPEAAVELFEQLEKNIVQRNSKGTGVGLYFCNFFSKLLGLTLTISRSKLLGGAKIEISVKS